MALVATGGTLARGLPLRPTAVVHPQGPLLLGYIARPVDAARRIVLSSRRMRPRR